MPLSILFILLSSYIQDSTIISGGKIPEMMPIKSVQINPDSINKINLEKQLLYDKYTLADTYPYKDTTRIVQWDKIKEGIKKLKKIRVVSAHWGVLENYKNKNGVAPLIKTFKKDKYKLVSDTFGVERSQAIPIYLEGEKVPVRYGRDGSLVKILEKNDSTQFTKIESIYSKEKWLVPTKYIKDIPDTIQFNKAIFIDATNQNIATVELVDNKWLVRSINPATTGRHKPPHAQETPEGIYLVQEKKYKMFFYKDGTTDIGGYAPYATRFTRGAYIHGVPVNLPRTEMIEYSPTLGTTPRSHMCVRNATSHAKFIYNWVILKGTIVFVYK